MASYRMAGLEFSFGGLTVSELSSFEIEDNGQTALLPDPAHLTLSSQTVGWVGERQREVEVWSARNGTLLKVNGGSDFFISADGGCISCRSDLQELVKLDQEILLGPALVLALSVRDVWCLHASAVICKNRLIAFLGESGQGKSTLAAYLSTVVADDILPVTFTAGEIQAWPYFPQLKLPFNAQPGAKFPERMPLDLICILAPADVDAAPELQLLAMGQAVQSVLRHTAGSRMFDAALLVNHLNFCAEIGSRIPVYQLAYPHRKDVIPHIKELLENIC